MSDIERKPMHTPLKNKSILNMKIWDICINQGFTNQSFQFEKGTDFQHMAINGDFQKFSMEMVCVGQIKVLKAVLTYPNQENTAKRQQKQSMQEYDTARTPTEPLSTQQINKRNTPQKVTEPPFWTYKHPNSLKTPQHKTEILIPTHKKFNGPDNAIKPNKFTTNSLNKPNKLFQPNQLHNIHSNNKQ